MGTSLAVTEIERFGAAVHLFARAMIQSPDDVGKVMDADLRDTDVPTREFSPWTESEVFQLSSLFPWEGLSGAIDQGLFGSAVGRTSQDRLCVRIYANSRGNRFLQDKVFPYFQPREPLLIEIAEVGSIKFARQRPCPGGVSISALSGMTTGTLGAWLKEVPSGNFIGISNSTLAIFPATR